MKRCEICDKETDNNFNVDFRIVGICESCANAIFIQQASWFVQEEWKKGKIQMNVDLGHPDGDKGVTIDDYKPLK